MKFIPKLALVLVSSCGFALAQQCDPKSVTTCMDGQNLHVVGMPGEPRSLTGAHEVDLMYANKFRYNVTIKAGTATPIAAAKVPSQFGPQASGGNTPVLPGQQTVKTAEAPALALVPEESPGGSQARANHPEALIDTSHGKIAARQAIPIGAAACDQTNPGWPTDPKDQIDRIKNCWIDIRNGIETDRNTLASLTLDINATIRAVADEQSCYQEKLKLYPDPSLSKLDAERLVTLANAKTCRPAQDAGWKDKESGTVLLDLGKRQDAVTDLTTAPGYPDWAKQPGYSDANAALVKETAALIAEATSYSTGAVATGATATVTQNYTDWKAAQEANTAWRDRLDAIASPDSLLVPNPLDHCHDFYGKGHAITVTFSALDLSSSAATPLTLTVANNTCLPATIASTGVGISFLQNPTYAFVAGDTTGAQVIGKTAVNKQAPVFAALYNVKLGRGQHLFPHGTEFFASPGVGFSTASSTAATDFLGGISMSFARRTLFITPALDFGQRTQLAPGFSVGTAKGSLTSVPTVTNWKPGFALIITFGLAPS